MLQKCIVKVCLRGMTAVSSLTKLPGLHNNNNNNKCFLYILYLLILAWGGWKNSDAVSAGMKAGLLYRWMSSLKYIMNVCHSGNLSEMSPIRKNPSWKYCLLLSKNKRTNSHLRCIINLGFLLVGWLVCFFKSSCPVRERLFVK